MIFACLALTVQAQDSIPSLKIGYLSYGTALKSMPGYTLQQQKLADMKAEYEKQDFDNKIKELENQKIPQ